MTDKLSRRKMHERYRELVALSIYGYCNVKDTTPKTASEAQEALYGWKKLYVNDASFKMFVEQAAAEIMHSIEPLIRIAELSGESKDASK